MRYAQGGGLTVERRAFREQLRKEAAERFVRGDATTVELDKGPVAHGWPDQTWTLSRIKTLIGRRFHKSYTVQGVAALLKRHGWTCQVPTGRLSGTRKR